MIHPSKSLNKNAMLTAVMFQIEALGSSSGKPSARVEVVNSGVLQTGCCCVAEQQLRCG